MRVDGSGEEGEIEGGAGFESESEDVWVECDEKSGVHVVEDCKGLFVTGIVYVCCY